MNKWTPRQYQLQAAKFLINRPHAGLLLDMGLGKTAITLAVLETLKKTKKGHKTFMVAPMRTLYTVWPEEIAKWDFNVKYFNLHDTGLSPGDKLPEADLYGINPESGLKWIREWQKIGHNLDFVNLLIDESSLFKNPSSLRFREIRKILHYFQRRWILTGTPAPNGMVDLWSQIFILDRGQTLGKYITQFRQVFCEPADYMGWDWIVQPDAEQEIYKRIAPYCLRLEAKDHIDMPELIHNRIPVKLTSGAMKMYKEMEETFLLALEEETVMSPNTAAQGIKCMQITGGNIYNNEGEARHLHDCKLDALVEIIEELQGKQAIVLYQFKHEQKRIAAALGNPPEPTVDSVAKFRAGKLPILMGHANSLAMGLNLQDHCSNIIFYGVGFDLAAHDQAVARVWRSGQKSKRVVVHYLLAENTIDEVIISTLQSKARTQKSLLNALKAWRH